MEILHRRREKNLERKSRKFSAEKQMTSAYQSFGSQQKLATGLAQRDFRPDHVCKFVC